MSRVFKRHGDKYVNTVRCDSKTTASSRVHRSKGEAIDYSKARTLSSWLYLKHDMSYKTYRGKSKERRDMLREEYLLDTMEIREGDF